MCLRVRGFHELGYSYSLDPYFSHLDFLGIYLTTRHDPHEFIASFHSTVALTCIVPYRIIITICASTPLHSSAACACVPNEEDADRVLCYAPRRGLAD